MTSQLFLQLSIPRCKDGRNRLFETPTIFARGNQSWPALKLFPKNLYTQFCLEEFLSLRRVPLGLDLLRGRPVRFVEVKVTWRKMILCLQFLERKMILCLQFFPVFCGKAREGLLLAPFLLFLDAAAAPLSASGLLTGPTGAEVSPAELRATRPASFATRPFIPRGAHVQPDQVLHDRSARARTKLGAHGRRR